MIKNDNPVSTQITDILELKIKLSNYCLVSCVDCKNNIPILVVLNVNFIDIWNMKMRKVINIFYSYDDHEICDESSGYDYYYLPFNFDRAEICEDWESNE